MIMIKSECGIEIWLRNIVYIQSHSDWMNWMGERDGGRLHHFRHVILFVRLINVCFNNILYIDFIQFVKGAAKKNSATSA